MIWMKVFLALVAGHTAFLAMRRDDPRMVLYWFFVTLYWAANALSERM